MHKATKYDLFVIGTVAFLLCTGTLSGCRKSGPEKTSGNTAVIPVQKLEDDFYDWHERHEQIKDLIKQKPVGLVFIGDSITHMFGGVPKSEIARGSDTWNRYYGHRKAVNMGFGWDRTQNVLWRLKNGELEGIAPKVVVLLIGTNNLTGTKNARQNTPAEIAEGITAVCKTIHQKTPTCKILLLGILPRSPERFVRPIQETNELLAPLDREEYITFMDVGAVFTNKGGLPQEELMHDSVHPNAKGYQLWAETLEPLLAELLADEEVVPN